MWTNLCLIFCSIFVFAFSDVCAESIDAGTTNTPIGSFLKYTKDPSSMEPITTTTSTLMNALAPTVDSDPQVGTWSVMENATNTTIVVQIAAQVDISFNKTNQESVKKQLNIPVYSNAVGDFAKNNESIILSWKATNVSQENSTLQLKFYKDELSKTYTLGFVNISIDESALPELNSSLKLMHSSQHFNTTLGHSYRCVKAQDFSLMNQENKKPQIEGKLRVMNFQFQAFKNDGKSNFGRPEDCSFETSDVVPIVVGGVLAGLVVIVLIAYLISRKRSQAGGYHSM